MIMKILNAVIVRSFLALSAVTSGFAGARAEVPGTPIPQLFINGSVTTVITASEPVRFVDISTDKVAGDRPIDNTVRLKPKDDLHAEGELLAIVTIVTERYRSQYALHYTAKMTAATTDHQILSEERKAMMIDRADVFVVLPGGLGTIDEWLSTLSQLVVNSDARRKIVVANIGGLFDSLVSQIAMLAASPLARSEMLQMSLIATSETETITLLNWCANAE